MQSFGGGGEALLVAVPHLLAARLYALATVSIVEVVAKNPFGLVQACFAGTSTAAHPALHVAGTPVRHDSVG